MHIDKQLLRAALAQAEEAARLEDRALQSEKFMEEVLTGTDTEMCAGELVWGPKQEVGIESAIQEFSSKMNGLPRELLGSGEPSPEAVEEFKVKASSMFGELPSQEESTARISVKHMAQISGEAEKKDLSDLLRAARSQRMSRSAVAAATLGISKGTATYPAPFKSKKIKSKYLRKRSKRKSR